MNSVCQLNIVHNYSEPSEILKFIWGEIVKKESGNGREGGKDWWRGIKGRDREKEKLIEYKITTYKN